MDKVQQEADKLTERYGTNDPWRLCAKLGFTVFISDLPPGVRGFYHRVEGKSMIHVSKWLSSTQMKLVCAHELGHAVLHQQKDVCKLIGRVQMEKEAESFKCCLLGLEQNDLENFSHQDIAGFTDLSQNLLILDF